MTTLIDVRACALCALIPPPRPWLSDWIEAKYRPEVVQMIWGKGKLRISGATPGFQKAAKAGVAGSAERQKSLSS